MAPRQPTVGSMLCEYTGVVLVRNGRVIGVDLKTYRFGNNDYNIGVELEFTGDADELFGVTSLKNKISLKKQAWDAPNKWDATWHSRRKKTS